MRTVLQVPLNFSNDSLIDQIRSQNPQPNDTFILQFTPGNANRLVFTDLPPELNIAIVGQETFFPELTVRNVWRCVTRNLDVVEGQATFSGMRHLHTADTVFNGDEDGLHLTDIEHVDMIRPTWRRCGQSGVEGLRCGTTRIFAPKLLDNNWKGYESEEIGWDRAAIKFLDSGTVTIFNPMSEGNLCPTVWLDKDCNSLQILGGVIKSFATGVFLEKVHSQSFIMGTKFEDCGHGFEIAENWKHATFNAIQLNASAGVEVRDCIFNKNTPFDIYVAGNPEDRKDRGGVPVEKITISRCNPKPRIGYAPFLKEKPEVIIHEFTRWQT